MKRITVNSHRKMVVAFMCAAALGAGMLAGCASGGSNSGSAAPEGSSAPVVETSAGVTAETSAETSAAPAPAQAAPLVEAGDASASASFVLANKLGDKVTSIELASIGEGFDGTFEACPFTVGDSLAPDQEATVHFAGDAATYDVRLTTMDGSEYTVHALPLATVESAVTVQVSDGTAYAVYEAEGAQVDTLASEQELAAAASAEAAPAEEQYVEEAYAPTYEDSYSYSYSDGGAQGEDGCATDIVLR